ncbi:WD40 repeat-like protein [Dendrothele bispora CBS 962.96]|uniref:WD40 repeat-like protein n=1 Tax=Dendrothele bispora (strain CBS 962.96) TaxID=1314807 RepID=A0A4V4HIU8_DENBC|nr:WD40 repeat-like protein [Dendrothele bispora CBS 962.96]
MLGPLQGLQSNQQQPQNQPQPQQQGQQQQNQASIPPPPPTNGQDFTLSSVLHFLQTEWRRYERDRNEWEIERAEMRARIALLEGERRSFENVKLDLMRRIKMLEYALRMERSKQLNQPTSSVPPQKLATIQSQAVPKDDMQTHKVESSGSSPRSDDSPLPDSRLPNGAPSIGPSGRPMSWTGPNWASGGAMAGLGKPPPGRDPKSRARSRDYLKQCLQEIQYLTSPQAMNPLPNRPLLNNSTIPLSLPNVPSFDQMAYNGRPRKVLPESGSLLNGMNIMSGPSSAPAAGAPLERPNPLGSNMLQQSAHQQPPQAPAQQSQQQPQPSPQSQQPQNGAHSQTQTGAGNVLSDKDKEDDSEPQQVTAIFRPDGAGEWREKLRLSHEASEQARLAREAAGGVWNRGDEDDVKDEEGEVDDDESTVVSEGEGTKVWKAKRTLRNHLDAVRAISFHPNELCLATGGDDCTVKIWRMDVAGLASSNSRVTTEIEPQLTLRGHSAAITRLIHAPSKQLLYSASLDSSIRVWALPPPSHTTYAPYDETRSRGELIGHTDAVWDLALVRDEGTLISCGAEGAVKVWDVSGPSGGGHLRLTWGWNGLESTSQDELHEDTDAPGATSVEALRNDLKKVAVAYQNAVVKIFDIETGKELSRLASDISYDGTPATQINRIASHPTMSLLVTAHEDKHIRIFDILTGQCTHSMQAHLDGVTSLSIDPSGFCLVSGSHDCSIRFWDLLGSRVCVQEITTHREKAREGVLDVEFHPTLPFMASAGADGVVKLYASS